MTNEQNRDHAGPWFPPVAVPPAPLPPPVEAPAEIRVPAWLVDLPEPEPEPERVVVSATPRKNRRRWLIPGAVSLVAAVGLVGIGAAFVLSGGTDSSTHTLAEPSLQSVNELTPSDWCPEINEPKHIMGSGKGDLRTGTGLIMWWEHAYYVERDPDALHSAFAPGAPVASLETMRRAVDAVPVGTKYCVEIVVEAPQRFRVHIDALEPSGKAVTWGQIMIVTDVEGRPMISAVRPIDE
ncbi:MAG: hypothetical protein LLG14_26020 [Nocardiaceae bacterium]|nr:hypothetical protein [Nocardiaceae bacterium]